MHSRKLKDIVKNGKLVQIDSNSTVKDACSVMKKNTVGSILIIDKRVLVGIFTERDLLNKIVCQDLDPNKVILKDVMSTNVIGLEGNKPFSHALHVMHQNGFRHVPVLENGAPIGVVSARDALGAEWQQFEEEVKFADHLFELI
jgi:CBS domain-containing protein